MVTLYGVYISPLVRIAATSDKIYQLLAHGQWFSPGTPVSPTTKTGRHDIADILLKVALNTKNQIKSIIRFAHIFNNVSDFNDHNLMIIEKLLHQGYHSYDIK